MQRLLLLLFFLSPYVVLSQNGPGGVSSGATDILLWLDGKRVNDDGSNPATSAEVVTWHDQSGNNRDVTRNINSVAVYSNPGVTFNNTGYLRRTDADLPAGNSPRSVVICASSPSTAQDDCMFFYGDADDNECYGILKIATSNGVRGFFFANDLDVAGGFTPSGTLKIITSTYQANSHNIYVNNNTTPANDGGGFPTGTDPNDGLQIGGWGEYATTLSNATMAEVIFYDKLLNLAEIRIVNNYLAAKYGLSISNELYDEDNAGNGNYDYDVAGIGQSGAGSNNLDAQASIIRLFGATGLGDGEYYLWGHDNGALAPTTSGIPAGVQARLTKIWRGSETGTITNFDVQFDLTNLGNVDETDLRLLIDSDNDGSFSDVGGFQLVSGAIDRGGNIYEFSDVTGLNNNLRFTLATANSTRTPLPIELLTFDVTNAKDKIVLNWTTATETNNDFFQVERSIDGLHWNVLGTLKGAGDSKELISYEYPDLLPYHGRNYYRLKQVDFDGKFEYSPVKSMVFDYGSTLFPNPTTGIVNVISKDDNADLTGAQVYNTMGQLLNDKVTITVLSKTQIQVDLTHLPPGIYLIKTRTTSEVVSKE
jgi:Secretion system C-terminal sorting domain